MILIPVEPFVQGQQCYNMLSHWIFIGHVHSTNKSCSKLLLLLVFHFNYHHPNHHHSPVQGLQNVAWNSSSMTVSLPYYVDQLI